MKTVHLTEDEVKMIKEDIQSTHDFLDMNIKNGYYEANHPKKEEAINDAATATSILKKLGSAE